jgi:hypothetical protein
MYKYLIEYLSVADNAGDAVLLHVSASSEKQGSGNKTSLKKEGTQRQILKLSYFYGAVCCNFIECFTRVVKSS